MPDMVFAVHVLPHPHSFSIQRIVCGFAFYEKDAFGFERMIKFLKNSRGSSVVEIMEAQMSVNDVE